MKFQRLYLCFRGCPTQWRYMQRRRKLFSAANPRWRPPNRTFFCLSVGVIQRQHFLIRSCRINDRRRRWCYLLSVDFTALYGYHKLLGYVYLYIYIFIYVFPVWRPLYWIFRCIPTLTTNTILTVKSAVHSSDTELWHQHLRFSASSKGLSVQVHEVVSGHVIWLLCWQFPVVLVVVAYLLKFGINPVNFVRIVQGARPLIRANIFVKFQIFKVKKHRQSCPTVRSPAANKTT